MCIRIKFILFDYWSFIQIHGEHVKLKTDTGFEYLKVNYKLILIDVTCDIKKILRLWYSQIVECKGTILLHFR